MLAQQASGYEVLDGVFWVKEKPAMACGGAYIVKSVTTGSKGSKISEEKKPAMTDMHACDVKFIAENDSKDNTCREEGPALHGGSTSPVNIGKSVKEGSPREMQIGGEH
jgi:hypothetical protein